MNRRITILFALVLLSASIASADVLVTIGDYNLAKGGTVQVPVYVSGDEVLMGMEFDFQIADGLGEQPSIQSVDLLTGTMWAGETTGALDIMGMYPQLAMISVTPTADHAAGNGTGGNKLLAVVTLAASATCPDGTYTLSMADTQNGPSVFVHTYIGAPNDEPYQVDMVGGVGTVHVPEPVSMSLLGLGALGLLARRRRS
jgi:hypothetical protein